MIEQSHRSLSPTGSSDLDALQRRANDQRLRHRKAQRLNHRWQQARESISSSVRSVVRLPTRYLLHIVIALVLPIAVVMSQIQPGTLLPQAEPVAPRGGGDFIAPVAPLSLNAGTHTHGDAPLLESADLPVPLSLVSRTEALAPVIVNGTVSGERIVLRNGPSTEYDAIGRLSANEQLQVIGRFGDWYQVREAVGKPVSWVPGELLNLPEGAAYTLFEVQENAIPAPPPPKVGMVIESGLQLRDGPGTNYVPVSKFDAGAQLEVIEIYQDWYHVGIPNGGAGWVKADFLQVEPSVVNRLLVAETIPDPNPALVGLINENSVNLRQGPDSKYGKVGSVNAGVQFDLIGKHNDWFKVQTADGTKAWVFSDLINVSSYVSRRVPVTTDFPPLPRPRQAVAGTGGGAGAAAGGPNLADIPASGDVASFAAQFVGSAYRYGGSSPSGFDCSGFTKYVYSKYGVSLPHNAAAQYNTAYGARVGSMNNLAPGDLVFFVGTTGGRGITHVALYIGGGRIVHAMTPRYGVQVSNLYDRYWSSHYYDAIRPAR